MKLKNCMPVIFILACPGSLFAKSEMAPIVQVIPSMQVISSCAESNGGIHFNVLFNISCLDGFKYQTIFNGKCAPKSRFCEISRISLYDKNELTYSNIQSIPNMTLDSSRGSVFVLGWGTFRTITIDTSDKNITYRESGKSEVTGKQVECFATTKCGPIK